MGSAVKIMQHEHNIQELLLMELLQILNGDRSITFVVNRILELIMQNTGVDAVGVRLKNADDFPYLCHNGFTNEFIIAENSLIKKTTDGGVCRDKNGNISLECTCGLILCGKTDPADPLFTKNGSAWTNDSLPFLKLSPDQDPRENPRNRCIHDGYRSVALIPIRNNGEILGLLQMNALRKNSFTLEMIEFFEGLSASIGIALMHYQKTEALRRSEEKFHNLFEKAPLGYQALDLDGRFIEVNQTWLDIFGYSREDIIGKWFGDFVTTEFIDLFKEQVETFKSEKNIHSEFFMLHKNGNKIYISLDGSIDYNPDRSFKQMHCILKDETEIKLARDKLKKKMDEMNQFHNLSVGREITMIELKKEVNMLLKSSGLPEKYNIVK